MEDQRTQAWFNKRKGRVTGSNVGAILGMNQYKTANDVMREMVRTWHSAEREFQGNSATEWGTFNEAGAIAEYQMETGNEVTETGFHIHPEHEWLGASPDGLVSDSGLIEIKAPYGQRNKNPPAFKTLEEQEHYAAQVHIQLYCTGRKWCDFYQWAPNGTTSERVNIDHAFLEWAIPKLKEFYDLFLTEIDNKDHLEPKRKFINSAMAEKLTGEYDELTEAVDRATQRKKEILDSLILLAGEKNADICGKKLTLVDRVGSVSYAKLVKDKMPDVDLEPYRGKGSQHWRFS